MTTQIQRAAAAATKWWADRLQSGDKEAFSACLLPLIEQDLNERGVCRLQCDYDPCGHLLTAVRAAGLRCSGMMFSAIGIFPRKHDLDVYPDRLEPKEGYGRWGDAIPIPVEPDGSGLPPAPRLPIVVSQGATTLDPGVEFFVFTAAEAEEVLKKDADQVDELRHTVLEMFSRPDPVPGLTILEIGAGTVVEGLAAFEPIRARLEQVAHSGYVLPVSWHGKKAS